MIIMNFIMHVLTCKSIIQDIQPAEYFFKSSFVMDSDFDGNNDCVCQNHEIPDDIERRVKDNVLDFATYWVAGNFYKGNDFASSQYNQKQVLS